MEPRIIAGGVHQDARGRVQHVNAFQPAEADRFYLLHPRVVGEVRGWVGHRRDAKWFFPAAGTMDLGIVAPAEWDAPERTAAVRTVRLDAMAPVMVHVPPGHFTALVARTPGCILVVFSTGRIESAKEDEFRLPPDHWTLGG
jgi:dTDP-4-dehydrorhamnose 3,5-epimerase